MVNETFLIFISVMKYRKNILKEDANFSRGIREFFDYKKRPSRRALTTML